MAFFEYALIGYFIGILMTAPVGPVNVMAIQRTVRSGFHHGVYVGLGAVVADTIYAAAAIFGVAAVTQFIDGQLKLIEFFGGALLIIFGLKIWHTHPHLNRSGTKAEHGFLGEAAAAFFLAITNPGTFLAFISFFGVLGEYRPAHDNHFGALVMVAGVAGGATTWWVTVSATVTRFKHKIDDRWLDKANHIAGVVLIAFGALIYFKLGTDLLLK